MLIRNTIRFCVIRCYSDRQELSTFNFFSGVDVNRRSLRETTSHESNIKPRNSDQRRTTCFASLLMKLRRMLRDMMLKRGYKDSKYTYEIRLLWIVENMSIIGYFHFRSIMTLTPLKICPSIGLTNQQVISETLLLFSAKEVSSVKWVSKTNAPVETSVTVCN